MLVNERNTPLQYVILEITSQNKLSIIKGDFFICFQLSGLGYLVRQLRPKI